MEDFVAHYSRWRLALLLLGAIGFVALGVSLAGLFGEIPRIAESPPRRHIPQGIVLAVGWTTTVFSGIGAVIIVKRFFDGKAQLQIGPNGVFWKPWSSDTIPWSEIEKVTVWTVRQHRLFWTYTIAKGIALHLYNPDRFPSRRLPSLLVELNRRMSGGDIHISLTGTNLTLDDAIASMEVFGGKEASPR